MQIHVQHRAINDGTETPLDVDMWPIRELPPHGGRRRMADIQIVVPVDSPAHHHLNAAFLDRRLYLRLPIRIRTAEHDGLWNIRRVHLPPPNDTLVRVSLGFARPA